MKLSRTEVRSILQFERGQALIATNNNKVPVIVKPSETEKALITTDRSELAAQAEARKQEALKKERQARQAENERRILEKQKREQMLNNAE